MPDAPLLIGVVVLIILAGLVVALVAWRSRRGNDTP
jgi:hypothetical protein